MAKQIHSQTIITKWYGHSRTGVAMRIVARTTGGQRHVIYSGSHADACQALVDKIGWTPEYCGQWYGAYTNIHGDEMLWLPIRKEDLIN